MRQGICHGFEPKTLIAARPIGGFDFAPEVSRKHGRQKLEQRQVRLIELGMLLGIDRTQGSEKPPLGGTQRNPDVGFDSKTLAQRRIDTGPNVGDAWGNSRALLLHHSRLDRVAPAKFVADGYSVATILDVQHDPSILPQAVDHPQSETIPIPEELQRRPGSLFESGNLCIDRHAGVLAPTGKRAPLTLVLYSMQSRCHVKNDQ